LETRLTKRITFLALRRQAIRLGPDGLANAVSHYDWTGGDPKPISQAGTDEDIHS